MIEQSQRPLSAGSSGDLETLQQRANQRHAEHKQVRQSLGTRLQLVRDNIFASNPTARRLPTRYLLHGLVALMLPAAVALSQLRPGMVVQQPAAATVTMEGDYLAPVAPLSLDHSHTEALGDAPLPNSDEIPIPLSLVSRNQALTPVAVPATVAAERIFIRSGPGTNYDAVGRLLNGTPLQVIGRYGDWFQVRESLEKPTFWVAGELINMPPAAVSTVWEIPQAQIPPAPPPKVGLIREEGTQLRDGPGTNYVSLTPLVPGQIDLIERYNDWLYISAAGTEGWVRADLVEADGHVLERLLVADAVPDPNPALVGLVNENQVNMRKGPDSRYERVDMVDSGAQVALIGKYKDWVRVQLSDGTKGWVFGDFINSSRYVLRRVPVTNDFPALPRPSRSVASGPAQNANLAAIAASGDVAGFGVQFVGYPYVWGATGPNAFDCSGFTWYVYRRVTGISLPRTAAAQFNSNYGAIIRDMGSLAPGDLVFYVNTAGPGITHVAIYIGGGRIVHAMSPGYGVQISSIYSSYWAARFYGGLRVYR